MPLILRIDVDKPYGRATLIEKIMSKVREDYWLPAIPVMGYLNPLRRFLEYLHRESIGAHIYFRKCTLPPKNWLQKPSLLNGHLIGLHAENTKNYQTFLKELKEVQDHFYPRGITSFTKHGSGKLKLGNHHYAPYEPEKYLMWAQESGVHFLFGNQEITDELSLQTTDNKYYSHMYWVDRFDRDNDNVTMEDIVYSARERNIIVIIHPDNFFASQEVKKNMMDLVSVSRKYNVSWNTV